MPRAAAFALFFLSLACSAPPAREADVRFREAPGGVRLVVNGVEVGSPEAAAVEALGAPVGGDAGPRAVTLAGPGGARAELSLLARAGRVERLALTFHGTPGVLMAARVALAKAAMRAGATCGPTGCAVRDASEPSARVEVTSALSWPTALTASDALAPPTPPAVAVARSGVIRTIW